MKKLKLFAISLCAMFVAVGAVSADNSEYPTVTDATKPDSLIGDVKPTIEGSETANVTVTVKAGEWHLLDLENDLNRPDGYTWVGLSFDMPEGVSEIKFNGDDTEHTGDFVEYFGFNVDELKEYTKKPEKKTPY